MEIRVRDDTFERWVGDRREAYEAARIEAADYLRIRRGIMDGELNDPAWVTQRHRNIKKPRFLWRKRGAP